MTFLVRSPAVFDNDEIIQKYIKSDKAIIVRGDGLSQSDVQHAWDEAGKTGTVDVVLFSVGMCCALPCYGFLPCNVGGTPKFGLSQGFYITPPNLVTQCFLNTMCTMPADLRGPNSQLRFIVVTSTGLTKSSHASLPFPIRFLYYFIRQPHKDKIGTERIAFHVSGKEWNNAEAAEPGEEIMGLDWANREGLPPFGSFKGFLLVRPLLLTDGVCLGDNEGAKAPYRVSEEGIYSWTVSRKDVGHFISDAILAKWDDYKNKVVNIGY